MLESILAATINTLHAVSAHLIAFGPIFPLS
jgi:hypothetical protein